MDTSLSNPSESTVQIDVTTEGKNEIIVNCLNEIIFVLTNLDCYCGKYLYSIQVHKGLIAYHMYLRHYPVPDLMKEKIMKMMIHST